MYDEGHAASEVNRWVSPTRAKELSGIARLRMRMRNTRWDQITLVNLHPWSLCATGAIHTDMRINAALPPTNEESIRLATSEGRKLSYASHLFTDYKIVNVPNESGDQTYEEVLPVSLALDYMYQHNNSMRNRVGGLFCYSGTLPPYQLLDDGADVKAWLPGDFGQSPDTVTSIGLQEAIDGAHRAQLAYYSQRMDAIDVIYANELRGKRPGQSRSEIGPNDRKMCEMLKFWGVIQKWPGWYTPKNMAAQPPRECPQCGHEAKASAMKCTNGQCTHIFEPYEAYKAMLIDVDTPGAKLALRRLTKDQLVELGLYPMVKPADEHRAEMLRDALAASGGVEEPTEEHKKSGGRRKAKEDDTE
jgi:hypothetical protein